MAVAAAAHNMLEDTSRAFDSVAADYDRSNTENSVLRAMRERTLAAVRTHVPTRGRVLYLGCGPGADAEALAREGFGVTAIDWSPAMIEETTRRIERSGLQARVDVRRLGIHQLGRLPAASFDAAFSDFGPLNCVPDLVDVAGALHGRLRPGGVFVASVIGRVVPWEIARYVGGGDVRRALVRFSRGFVAVPLNGRRVWTRYYTPGAFTRPFVRAGFVRVSLRALGLFVPPPYMDAFARRHPQAVTWLQRLDDAAGSWPVLRGCGDHFLIVMRRT